MSHPLVVRQNQPHDVYIGRPSKWGNPFSHLSPNGTLAKYRVATREDAVAAYENWIQGQPQLLADLPELRGKVLGCWCAPLLCHGEVLVRLANAPPAHVHVFDACRYVGNVTGVPDRIYICACGEKST